MRKFNKNEQNFIKKIIDEDKKGIVNFVDFLKDQYLTSYDKPVLVIDQKDKKAFFFHKNQEDQTNELRDFYEIIFLCVYLVENRYIQPIPSMYNGVSVCINKQFTDKPARNIFGKLTNENGDYYQNENIFNSNDDPIFNKTELDKVIYNYISNNFLGIIFITEGLKKYVENKFQTEEEKRFKTTTLISIIAIAISIFISTIGYFKPDTFLEQIHCDVHKIMEKLVP